MARTVGFNGRLTFWDGIRSIFSFSFNFTPFSEVGAHLFGFGFRVLWVRGRQFSLTGYVPFYHAYWCRHTTRMDAAQQAEAERVHDGDGQFVIKDMESEAKAKARQGIYETDEEYAARIATLRALPNPTPVQQRIIDIKDETGE